MIDYIRITLYTALVIMVFLLYQAWVKEHSVQQVAPTSQTTSLPSGRYIPQAPTTTPTTAPSTSVPQSAVQSAQTPAVPVNTQGQLIHITTDVMQVSIDTHGGDVTQVKLNQYPQTLGSKDPFVLLNDDPKTRYIAESGLLSDQGPDSQQQAQYTTPQTAYTLEPGQDNLAVTLTWQNESGVKVNKVFTFTRGSYEINVAYQVNNQSSQPWAGRLYTQLSRTDLPPESSGGLVNLTTFFGAAISTPDKPFEKFTFKNMRDTPLDVTAKDGWAAMVQHYFISAWVPPADSTHTFYSRSTADGMYTVGMIGQPINVAPGATATTTSKLYAGPSIASNLEKTAPNLNLTIDFGWFWFISVIIFWMMQKIYNVVGNWGWAIVLVTIIIKLMFYQLSAKSYRSMRDLKRLQPKIEAIKERYKDDRQKLTQATLELYRQEKVSPVSGCLPILIQIPVFIGLYWVLVESVELRQAPWILWIHDLSTHDPYYVLPILMGLSMFLQQWMNPPAPDPMQQRIMLMMPVVFTVLFANFPAGLMLYWFLNTTLSFMQQWYIMHSMEKSGKKKEAK